jgi:hypothetical protein
MVFLVFVTLFIYSYGTTYAINCAFDFSEKQTFRVKVIDKRHSVTRGRRGSRHHHYYLRITPWGHHYDTEEISTSLNRFNSTAIGDSVNIGLHKGLLDIPWYRLE